MRPCLRVYVSRCRSSTNGAKPIAQCVRQRQFLRYRTLRQRAPQGAFTFENTLKVEGHDVPCRNLRYRPTDGVTRHDTVGCHLIDGTNDLGNGRRYALFAGTAGIVRRASAGTIRRPK